MPAIAKTSDADVIAAARSIIAERGVDSLSMSSIAESVGIKAPSLYKRFKDRGDIVRSVQISEFSRLHRKLEADMAGLSPADALRAIARIQWTLAEDCPAVYAILFTTEKLTSSEDIAIRTQAMMPVLSVCRALVGSGAALAAARTIASYIHGFISLQQSGSFDGAPGLDGSFYFGLNAIIKGIGQREVER